MRRSGPLTTQLSLLALLASLAPSARGQIAPVAPPAAPVQLDRVVVRWHAPETGGVRRPQFIFERELAFEARLEALADPDAEPGLYRDRHVRAALDRHIAETLLASLPISPAPTSAEVAKRAEAARIALEQRARGRARLLAAAAAEGMSSDELDALLRRQARASLYLDRMVAPMLEPTDFELKIVLRSGATPFKDQRYEDVAPALKRWYVGQRLAQALDAYYQNARARVSLSIVSAR
ncbi:hypothetical protein WME90_39850 [Sorangium sp. So ce375]|uniref:hypothetical protein n=1 Tax=Sorangium sp. So ce375 TaxID=3133306 RepID=UPI003F5AF92C